MFGFLEREGFARELLVHAQVNDVMRGYRLRLSDMKEGCQRYDECYFIEGG